MSEIEIRPAISSDINSLIQFEHSVSTNTIWQMDRGLDEHQVNVSFRQTHLPRPIRLVYPRKPEKMKDDWQKKAVVFVALIDEEPVGYMNILLQPANPFAWVTDLVVDEPSRRKGIACELLLAGREWAGERTIRRMILEMHLKNHPASCLAQKMGFQFCGYNDHYYENQGIALFFGYSFR
jgi:ribosomal protein S18 acetylase RimI-like enzyme